MKPILITMAAAGALLLSGCVAGGSAAGSATHTTHASGAVSGSGYVR